MDRIQNLEFRMRPDDKYEYRLCESIPNTGRLNNIQKYNFNNFKFLVDKQ